MMYSNKLIVFITVSQYLNFSEAAKHLHMAQSAVSRIIAELEKDFGASLFERSKKGCLLTPAGEVLLKEAFKMLTLGEETKIKMEKMVLGQSGKLVIGYASELMIDPLVPYLQYFTRTYPDVELSFINSTSVHTAKSLREGVLDIALGRLESLVMRDSLDWKFCTRFPLCVVVTEEHRFAQVEKVSLEDLSNETILLLSREYNPGFFDVINTMFLSKGITPLLNTNATDRMTTLLMVQLGKGVTILSKQYMNIHHFHNLVPVPIDDENAFFDIGVAWNKNIANPAVNLFLAELDNYLTDSSS